MNSLRYAFRLLLAATISQALIQAEAATEITHSLLFPEGDAAWSVTLERTRPPNAKLSPGAVDEIRDIKSIDAVRVGNLRRDMIHWTDGSTTQYWMVKSPPLALMESENGGPVRAMKLSYLRDNMFDASTFSFVGKSTFIDLRDFKGKKCRFYEARVEVIDGEKKLIRAWIDDLTLKPVAWSDGMVSASFSFELPVPTDPLVLPAKFEKEVERYKAYYTPPKRSGS